MLDEVLSKTVASLKAERARLDAAITALERAVGITSGVTVVAKRRGRPPGSKAARAAKPAPARAATPKGGKAPRGMLKTKIHEALKAAGKPISPTELRDRLVAAGYPVQNPKNFYAQVFVAAGKDPAVTKTKAGFALKAGGGDTEKKATTGK